MPRIALLIVVAVAFGLGVGRLTQPNTSTAQSLGVVTDNDVRYQILPVQLTAHRNNKETDRHEEYTFLRIRLHDGDTEFGHVIFNDQGQLSMRWERVSD